MLAARATGAKTSRLLLRELLPNVVPAAVSFALIGVAIAIVLEGSLAFLGLSIGLPTSSLGNIINDGVNSNNLQTQPLHRAVAVALHLPPPHRPQPHGRPPALVLRPPRGEPVSRWSRRPQLSFPDVGSIEGPLLEVIDLHTSFRTGRGLVRAVDGVSFTLARGRTLGVVGESGSGKTVLSRSIMGLVPGVQRRTLGHRALLGPRPHRHVPRPSCARCGACRWP